MRYTVHLFLLTGLCLYVTGCSTEGNYLKNPNLISNKLESWECYPNPETKMQEVWHIEDGVLFCTGEPLGYLYTKRDYRDFVLKLEWRWPPGKKPGKGGVLIRMTGEHKIWPKSLEAQLNAGSAGDFWGLAGYQLSGPVVRMNTTEHQKFGKLTNLRKTKNLEKPPGEWNSYEIIAKGDTVTLIINGEEVNRAIGCDVNPGRICLTSEGDEIHFRNVVVTPIPN